MSPEEPLASPETNQPPSRDVIVRRPRGINDIYEGLRLNAKSPLVGMMFRPLMGSGMGVFLAAIAMIINTRLTNGRITEIDLLAVLLLGAVLGGTVGALSIRLAAGVSEGPTIRLGRKLFMAWLLRTSAKDFNTRRKQLLDEYLRDS